MPGFEMVHRFWLMTTAGCYATHGEAFFQPNTHQFFRQGGHFIGESPERLAFLKSIIDAAPGPICPMWKDWRLNHIAGGIENEFYIYYLGVYQNLEWIFNELPEGVSFKADIIDTWNMTIVPVENLITKGTKLELPGNPCMAIRLRCVR